ncbi:type I restriction-modification system, specificity subunit S [Lacticaseibacillus casei A2-362]|nr:type I restriction-modification system, specificity subunit S [Lacticaseibacillus casei A2-362]
MNAEQHVPPFRFKGFSDFWEQRKLSDLAMFNPRLELPDSFQYVDLESVSGTELINHRTETKSSAPSRAQRLAKKGDIFYQTVRPYQKNNYLYEKSDDDYVFSTGYAQLRPYEDGYFLFSRLQENGFVSTVLDHSTGTSYPAINSNDLAKLEIMVPLNLNEQQAIGKLFRHIDNAIALHQHKLAKLKELKKGYLQKLFPQNGETVPEFRFKGYSDAWEKRKLSEVTNLITKGTTPREKGGRGEVNFIKVENLSKNGNIFTTSKVSVSEHQGYLARSILQENDILFSIAGSLGRTAIVPKLVLPANTNQALAIIRLSTGCVEFVATYLSGEAIDRYIRRNPTVGAQPNISLTQVASLQIDWPSLHEQEVISKLFARVKDLIAATQCKLDLLKKLKKGYLQKMFC